MLKLQVGAREEGMLLYVAIADKSVVTSCGECNSVGKHFYRELVTLFLTSQPQRALTQSLILPRNKVTVSCFLIKALLYLTLPRTNMKLQIENVSLH